MRTFAACAVFVALLVGCGDDRPACDRVVREQLDSRSVQHVFPGTPEPSYVTDPPTSGPHQVGGHPTGVLHEPISRPVQVAMLEDGGVLVQYRGLNDNQRSRLEELAQGMVTVAPNADLNDAVVATAWTAKQTCRSVDTEALRAFIRAFQGKGVGHP